MVDAMDAHLVKIVLRMGYFMGAWDGGEILQKAFKKSHDFAAFRQDSTGIPQGFCMGFPRRSASQVDPFLVIHVCIKSGD